MVFSSALPRASERRSRPANNDSRWIHEQPSLDDLLNDDVIAPVLRRDGLTVEDVRQVVAAVKTTMRRGLCLQAA